MVQCRVRFWVHPRPDDSVCVCVCVCVCVWCVLCEDVISAKESTFVQWFYSLVNGAIEQLQNSLYILD